MTRSQMTKRIHPAVLIAMTVALLGTRPAGAQTTAPTGSIQTVSDTAGATLLGPYFEVDLSNPTGMNTIFTVNNMGANTLFTFGQPPQTFPQQNGPTAVLAHVAIW